MHDNRAYELRRLVWETRKVNMPFQEQKAGK